MHTPAADPAAPPREPWRRRLVGSLLYGSNVDRVAKTRARILLAVLIFALGYAVIATRLVMFATAPEGHGSRRAIAVRRAAPDYRRGRGIGAAHRGDAGDRRRRTARATCVQAPLRLAQARDHVAATRANSPA